MLNNFLQICNAVAVAGLLNAILVIPQLDFHSVWMDPRQVIKLFFSGSNFIFSTPIDR